MVIDLLDKIITESEKLGINIRAALLRQPKNGPMPLFHRIAINALLSMCSQNAMAALWIVAIPSEAYIRISDMVQNRVTSLFLSPLNWDTIL